MPQYLELESLFKKQQKNCEGKKCSPKNDAVEDVPTEPLQYSVKFSCRYSVVAQYIFETELPPHLDELVDKQDYLQTVAGVNGIIQSIFKKWYHSHNFYLTTYITGILLFVPIIPHALMDIKRRKKIFQNVDKFLQSVNTKLPVSANYTWVIQKSPFRLFVRFSNADKVPVSKKVDILRDNQAGSPSM